MTGTGTQNDPYIVTSMEEIKELVEGYEDVVDPDSGTTTRVWNIPSNSTTYIEFPDVYAGPKVMDYRSRGWNPFRIKLGGSRVEVYIHIHFNGWTILGLSIMDIDYWLTLCCKGSNSYTGAHLYMYDLIMKNIYILGNSAVTRLFSLSSDTDVGGNSLKHSISFYACKFSGVMDGQNTNVIAFDFYHAGNTGSYMTFDSCSFNIKISTRNSSYSGTLIKNNYGTGYVNNTIFNFTSNNYAVGSSVISCSLRFCKIVGSIRIPFSASFRISLGSSSVYNVADIEVVNYSNAYESKLILEGSNGINIVNKTRLRAEGSYPMTLQNSDAWKVIENAADMVDPEYLNSIDFICGDTPT